MWDNEEGNRLNRDLLSAAASTLLVELGAFIIILVLIFYKDPSTTGPYVTCSVINIGFMGVRIGFRVYEYFTLWRDPYLLDLDFAFFIVFYLCSGVWSGFLIYANYVFFQTEPPSDKRIIVALLLLVMFGYVVLVEGAVFTFVMAGLFIAAVFYRNQQDGPAPLEEVC